VRYDDAAVARVRAEWAAFCMGATRNDRRAEAALDEVVRCLQAGLPADVVAALIHMRAGSGEYARAYAVVAAETRYCERVRGDVRDLEKIGQVSADAAAAIDAEIESRLQALAAWSQPLVAAPSPAVTAASPAAKQPSTLEAPGPVTPEPATPARPPISLRDLFAEHSVLILAAVGAFLLVVATVLFELYGTVGLGGGVRLAAVAVLDVLFAGAGYLAYRRPGLRAVGQIYIGLAAVLLPLVGVAAWTFLELGAHGITVEQAVAVTGAACAFVYGGLAMRLDLRAYGVMAGVAILASALGISRWAGGDHWMAVGLALTPLVFAAWQRSTNHRAFADFPWFAHLSAAMAVIAALRFGPDDWLWTSTLAAIAISYLAWQALAPHPSRAWTGEAAIVLAAATSAGPLGVNSNHFLIPMLTGAPLLVLSRWAPRLGVVGRLYRAHPAHLHLAVLAGLALAIAEESSGETWPLAMAFWTAIVLYSADFALGSTELTGYTLRAALPLALAATAHAAELHGWGSVLIAAAGAVYLVPFLAGPRLDLLKRHASPFFYVAFLVSLLPLTAASVGAGHWEITVSLLVSTLVFGAASELGAVRFAALAARGMFSVAWFVAVDALNAQGWRGPFDALLALFYTGLSQVRAARDHAVATSGRRWFVHAAAAAALALCFTGPDDQLWWRLAAAFGLLAVAYWWQELTLASEETPVVAWSAAAMAAISLVIAAVPHAWQGAAVVAAALLLTAAWAGVRVVWTRPNLEESGFGVLFGAALVGGLLALREDVPQWHQSAAALLGAAIFLLWSSIPTQTGIATLRPYLRSASAVFATLSLFLGAAVLRLDAAWAGLIALAIAALHAEWNVRTRSEVERWYALGAPLVLGPVIFFWPYAQALPALMAVELIVLTAITTSAAVRRQQWYLAYPAALSLVLALHLLIVAFGRSGGEFEEIAMATLAWAIGAAGLVIRTTSGSRWALATEAGAASIALVTIVYMIDGGYADPIGIALLAYAPQVYTATMQERQRWGIPAAAALALAGAMTLLHAHDADTIYYAAALGVVGLVIWLAGWVTSRTRGRAPIVDMHRYLGLGLLGAACLAGFFFPDKTGARSLGAGLAAFGFLVTGAVLWFDARTFGFRPNVYIALAAAATSGYFLAREVSLTSWQLVPPGIGLVAVGLWLRDDPKFHVERWIRRGIVLVGIGLAMGWAAVFMTSGDLYWLVVLLIEGAITVGVGITFRSQVTLAGGGAAIALASARALLSVAEAGYLFIAFAAVALVLIIVATVLALGRERYASTTHGVMGRVALWD
jgi:hypothetical protein